MSEIGTYYVYKDEDGNAVAVAKWEEGRSGGAVGVMICKFGLPTASQTWADINSQAADIAASLNNAPRIAALEAENADLRSGEYLVRVIEERERLRKALEASRDVHAGLAEFILNRSDKANSGLTKEQAKGVFADLQRARLAADAALEALS